MKFLFLLLLTTLIAESCNSQNKVAAPDVSNTLCLFSRPLVIGASVSAGYGTKEGGPSTVLAKMLNPESEIINKASGGATSVEILQGMDGDALTPSVVLAFDLFFWDAARNQCGSDFIASTRKFFKTFQEKETPMIIGRIPVSVKFPAGIRLAGTRPCARIINNLIDELCTPDKNCLIYDPKDCTTAMKVPQSADGVPYFSDKLHTSDTGNKFCAQRFIETEKFKTLDCTVKY